MQSIEENKSEHPTGTLATTFHKPTGEANTYVYFRYSPLIIFNHAQVQVPGSMNADPINSNRSVGNEQRKDGN